MLNPRPSSAGPFPSRHRLLSALLLAGFLAGWLGAAPFAKRFWFRQPDGTRIELWGEGDEFYAVFETLDGFTVVFDPAVKAYCYARLAADGETLESTGVQVQRGDPVTLGLGQHLRAGREAIRRQVAERRRQWEEAMDLPARWNELKATSRARLEAAATGAQLAPSPATTVGPKVGLCLLVDFDDDPATVAQAEISSFCNGDAYTGYGNNGSVKQYFQDNSGGLLTYSNVVTIYIRIPNSLHPKSYYNDTTKDCGAQANLLIRDAIAVMKALPNYTTEILPQFAALTVDGANQLIACNVFYAGDNGGRWTYGLWPHSWSLYNVGAQELSPGGKKVWHYQITDIGDSLGLGTFCHENGHMLCGFPDIYDHDYDSSGGAGRFCLMNSGGSGSNPAQICAYLKTAAGWATLTELNSASRLTAVVSAPAGTNFNHFYRYRKPGVSTEYYLMENRQRSGRDAGIPGAGVAIWHVDELGDHNNQSLVPNTTHDNYEVTLVQADNQWHLQWSSNSGDANDLYYLGNSSSGYRNLLTDSSAPNAHWWDGSSSGLKLRDFSVNGTQMTFKAGEGDAYLALEAESATLVAPMGVQSDPLASEGQFITSSTVNQGQATFTVNIPLAGNYIVWCRVRATNASQNTFRVSADGGSEDYFDAAEGTFTNAWQWSRVNGRGGTGVPRTVDPRLFSFTVGTHTLLFRCVEAGAPLDRLLLTSDPAYTPTEALPVILTQPQTVKVATGVAVVLNVVADGQPFLSYQWLREGTNISGATNMTLVLSNAQPSQSGNYSVIVANFFGAVTSQVAILTVIPMPSSWVAYNDHFAGPTTHSNATAWNVFDTDSGAPGSTGPLKDIVTGALMPVTLTLSNFNANGGTTAGAPLPGTPAYQTFNGFVDFGNGNNINHSIQIPLGTSVAHLFSGLNPDRRYILKGTAVRGGTGGTAPNYYSNRWTLVELAGADSSVGCHTSGVLTSDAVPSDLAPNQAAFNSGMNTVGGMVVWEDIAPGSDGSFAVVSSRYTGTVPGGSSEGSAPYALIAVRLEEITTNGPPVILFPPRSLEVMVGTPVTFSVSAAGKPTTFQWFKDGGAISNATNTSHTIAAVTTNDAGAYTVVVGNAYGAVTSQVATLAVTVPPGWVAFNDHAAGAGTHVYATRWNAGGTSGGAPGSSGRLKNILNGTNLPVTLSIISNGGTVGGEQRSAAEGSPAYATFNGFVDFQGTPNPAIEVTGPQSVSYHFAGLNSNMLYHFKGTAIRGGDPSYSNRWALFEIAGVDAFLSAHTANAYTNGLSAAQVAINTGVNNTPSTGDMAVWNGIRPGADGAFDVISRQYTGPIPGGMADGSKGYAVTGIRLEETPASVFIVRQPTNQSEPVGGTATFRVVVVGTPPLRYQWLTNGARLPDATNATCTFSNVTTEHVGLRFSVVASNALGAVTSSEALLTLRVPMAFDPSGLSLTNGALHVRVVNVPSTHRITVEASTNLQTWATIRRPLLIGSGSYEFTDWDSTNLPMRFYRLTEQP